MARVAKSPSPSDQAARARLGGCGGTTAGAGGAERFLNTMRPILPRPARPVATPCGSSARRTSPPLTGGMSAVTEHARRANGESTREARAVQTRFTIRSFSCSPYLRIRGHVEDP
ncbi:hypothetical protein GCM10027064_15670 [Microbacterium petrolearium]